MEGNKWGERKGGEEREGQGRDMKREHRKMRTEGNIMLCRTEGERGGREKEKRLGRKRGGGVENLEEKKRREREGKRKRESLIQSISLTIFHCDHSSYEIKTLKNKLLKVQLSNKKICEKKYAVCRFLESVTDRKLSQYCCFNKLESL